MKDTNRYSVNKDGNIVATGTVHDIKSYIHKTYKENVKKAQVVNGRWKSVLKNTGHTLTVINP